MVTDHLAGRGRQARKVRRPLAISTILAWVLVVQMQFIPAYASRFHAKPVEWIVMALWVLAIASEEMRSQSTLVRDAVAARRFEIGALMGFGLVVYVNGVMGRGFGSFLYTRIFPEFVFLYMFGLVHSARRDGSFGGLVYLTLLCLGLSAAMSIPMLTHQSNLVRYLASREQAQTDHYIYGVAPHAQYKNWAVMLPAMIAFVWTRVKWKRGLGALALGAMVHALLLSTFRAVFLMLGIGGLLLGFLRASLIALRGGSRRLGGAFLTIGAVVALAALSPTVISTLGAGRTANATSFLVDSVEERGVLHGDVTGRASLAQTALKTIRENPFFGVGAMICTEQGYQYVSNHIQWVDSVAEFGVIGMIPMFAFLVMVLLRFARQAAETDTDETMRAGLLTTAILFVVAGSINPLLIYWSTSWLFLFLGGDVVRKPVAAVAVARRPGFPRRGMGGRRPLPARGSATGSSGGTA